MLNLWAKWAMMPYDTTAWWLAMLNRKPPAWATPNTVVLDTPIARLRDFSTDSGVTPTLIFPPMAGHASTIVDYPGQSQVQLVLDHGLTNVHVIDWLGATRETRNTTIQDRLQFVSEAVTRIAGDGKVNIIGNCQGGWESAIYAALHPQRVNSLTVAGAPVDTSAGDSEFRSWLPLMAPGGDLTLFRNMVAASGGMWPGMNQIAAFMMLHPTTHTFEHLRLYNHIREPDVVERFSTFYDWYFSPVDLPGAFYLWALENIFIGNKLYRGTIKVDGVEVALKNITAPVFLLAGKGDDITPPEQVMNMAGMVSGPVRKVMVPGGHIGLFIGRNAQRNFWSQILDEVRELGRQTSS
jgi:polyhydroxyalkanoate depolymerase